MKNIILKNKLKIIIGIVLIVLVFWIFLLLGDEKDTKETRPNISPTKPKISGGINGNFTKIVKFTNLDFDFPKELPFIEIETTKIDLNYALDLKNKLGFSENLKEFFDVNEGIKYYSNSEKQFLVITPKTAKIKYGLNNLVLADGNLPGLSEEEIINKANEFLLKNKFDLNNLLTFSEIKYLKRSPVTEGLEICTKDQAEVYQVNFKLAKIGKHRIVNSFSSNPTTYVQFLKNGDLYYFESLLIQNVVEKDISYPIKNINDVKNSINEAKMIDITGDYLSVSEIKFEDINEFEITSIEVGYLKEEGNNKLQPIFIMKGNVRINNSSASGGSIYLPAFK